MHACIYTCLHTTVTRSLSTRCVLAVIGQLRSQRMAMVQSLEQLEFIYTTLLSSCLAMASGQSPS